MNKRELLTEKDVSLKTLSTFKVGGTARHLFRLQKTEDLKGLVLFARENNLPIFVLGGGSNILFSDNGFMGLVIKIENKGVKFAFEKDFVHVTAEAGECWDDFVLWTLERGFFGLQNLSGIPGTVGASPIQNIGAYGVEVKDYIYSVEVFDILKLESAVLSKAECGFGYRDSIFKKYENKHLIVTSVTFILSKIPNVRIDYKDLKMYFENKPNPNPQDVRDAVIAIRTQKFPDLNTHGTAGSFFKNIICDKVTADRLSLAYPDMPAFDVEDGMKKISTAYILDKVCGLKDYREGDVGLFAHQSLVVVNYGKATSEEVKSFISKIKSIVKEKTGMELKEEVVLA